MYVCILPCTQTNSFKTACIEIHEKKQTTEKISQTQKGTDTHLTGIGCGGVWGTLNRVWRQEGRGGGMQSNSHMEDETHHPQPTQ